MQTNTLYGIKIALFLKYNNDILKINNFINTTKKITFLAEGLPIYCLGSQFSSHQHSAYLVKHSLYSLLKSYQSNGIWLAEQNPDGSITIPEVLKSYI